MPKRKGLYVNLNIPKLLQKQTIDSWMFAYVIGYRHVSPIPILQVKAGIEHFMEDFGLEEDDFPLDSAIVAFFRMMKEAKELPELKNITKSQRNEICKHENGC